MELFNKVPPCDQEAEASVLGAMLFDSDGVQAAAELLRPEDFYRPDNRMVFEACVSLHFGGAPVDVVTLKDKLTEMGAFEKVGGLTYISEIAGTVYTSAHVKHHAKIVAEKSLLRKLIRAAGEIASHSFEEKESVEAIISLAEKEIFGIMEGLRQTDFVHLREILTQAFEKIEKTYASQEKVTGVKTGFTDFDYKTAGLQPSDLILIAARPSMGKTAFALNIAQNAAVRNKVSTAVFSLEMSKEQLSHRLLCQEALLDSQRLRTGDLNMNDFNNILRAMGALGDAPIYIDDTPAITPMEIRSKCRRLKLEKGLELIIIDYLQLMSGNARNDNRQQEISEISRSLKALAREMNTPVIALSQLSRACEQRADKRPMLSDLRESGAIEQDADVVAFLYRDGYYNPDSENPNIAEVNIAKQRNGPTGMIELVWRSDCTKFEDRQKGM